MRDRDRRGRRTVAVTVIVSDGKAVIVLVIVPHGRTVSVLVIRVRVSSDHV
jgi:hypothetical protein